MDEKHFEQAQQREERDREAGIARVTAEAKERFEPVMVGGVACCHDCIEPLPAHRIEAGICVGCKQSREHQKTRFKR
jgi:hypothetical protein